MAVGKHMAVQAKPAMKPLPPLPRAAARTIQLAAAIASSGGGLGASTGGGGGGGKDEKKKPEGGKEAAKAEWDACSVCYGDGAFRLHCGHHLCSTCFFQIVATAGQQQFYVYEQHGNQQLGANYHTRASCPMCRADFNASDQQVATVSRMLRQVDLTALLASLAK